MAENAEELSVVRQLSQLPVEELAAQLAYLLSETLVGSEHGRRAALIGQALQKRNIATTLEDARPSAPSPEEKKRQHK